MLTLSNAFSFLRGPLAFLFLIDRIDIRVTALLVAGISDFIDGYLARRYKSTSRFGTFLDPMMDKFFVFFALAILFREAKLPWWGLLFMFSRDISYFLFALYITLRGKLKTYSFRTLIGGKAMTILQFLTLFVLSLGIAIPPLFFITFLLCGAYALIEVFYKEISIPITLKE